MSLPVLHGARVTLVPATRAVARTVLAGRDPADALALVGLAAGPGWPHPDTADALRPLAEHDGEDGCWLVGLGGLVVGDAGWFGPPDPAGDCEIGYGIAPPSRRQGLGREAVGVVLRWVEAQPGVRRVAGEVLVGNEASRRLLEQLGFTDDGTGAPPYVRLVRPVAQSAGGRGRGQGAERATAAARQDTSSLR